LICRIPRYFNEQTAQLVSLNGYFLNM
jgi:hypothetical protein